MSHRPIGLALLDADPLCQREVARRLHGELRILNWNQARSADHLEGIDAVAILGNHVDVESLASCLNSGRKVLLSGAACRGERTQQLLALQLTATLDLLTIGNPIASLPSRQLIQQQTAQGKLGEPGLIRTHRWGQTTESQAEVAQTIPLVLQYELDQVLRYFRQVPQRVYAAAHASHRGAMIHLTWAHGAMALIDFIAELPNQQAYSSFSVIGSRGAAYADDHQNTQLLIQAQTHGRVAAEVISPAAHMVTSFLAGWLQSDPPASSMPANRAPVKAQPHATLQSWVRSQLVAEAVAQSMLQHSSIHLADDPYLVG